MKGNSMRVSGRIFFAIILCLLTAGGTAAQGQPEIESLEVEFWPEFDRSDMLVIYNISLADTVELPAVVSVPIPADVGGPHAVAVSNKEGSLYTSYTTQDAGDWVIITLQATTSEALVEYYADLQVEGSERSFTFTWPGGLDVGDFSYKFQQPVGAEEPTIDPPPTASSLGNYDLTYFSGSLGALDAETTTSIQLSYVREQSALTVDLIQPLGRPETTEGETPDLSVILTWVGGGLVGILIVVGAFMLLRLWRNREQVTHQRPRRRPRKRVQAKEQIDAATVFCHACGRQAGASDHYCRSCGSQLRR
jgi:hypothetical protein